MRTHFIAAIPLIALVTSCASRNTTTQYMAGFSQTRQHDWTSSPIPDDISYWEDDNVLGPPSIRINRPQQKAFFYKGNTLVGISRISTGKEGHDTPAGRYKVTEMDKNYYSRTYGVFKEKGTGRIVNDDVDMKKDKVPPGCYYEGAAMKNFLRFNGGVGMHSGYLPGYAASHGCVRMPDRMAVKFFENARLGMPVIVE